jgi:hypothetical protein
MKTIKSQTNISVPVQIPLNGEAMFGDLQVPDGAQGLVLFIFMEAAAAGSAAETNMLQSSLTNSASVHCCLIS